MGQPNTLSQLWIMVGREGDVEFGFDDFRDCRDVEVIVGYVVGDIPGSVEDGTTLD